ncbi:MAG: hypothetical protein Q7R79_05155 [bacterium]|nr:hypothetical protein [bacterium]
MKKCSKSDFEHFGQTCSWTPRVQVLDNWGWGNGQAVTDNTADGWDDVCSSTKGGCYNNPNGIKACGLGVADENVKSAWTYFDGKIELTVPVQME